MHDENYIDLADSERDTLIYRIIPTDRLFELFTSKQNVLVKTRKWYDPFENFILQSPARLRTGERVTIGFRDRFYGQCWTFHKASDAMWRIYSRNKGAVRIRSTRTLFVKRLAFKHEREIRLLFIPHENEKTNTDFFPYPVDPHALIDQIMIDPRRQGSQGEDRRENCLYGRDHAIIALCRR